MTESDKKCSPPGSLIESVKFTRFGKAVAHRKPISYVVEGLFLERSTVGVIGPTGAMKTLLVGDLCASVASGIDWFGRKTLQGCAFMLLGEGNSRIGLRLEAFEIERKVSLKSCPLFVSNRSAGLLSFTAAQEISDLIARKSDLAKSPPMLICIDPVSKVFSPGDENSASDMSRLLENVDTCFTRRFGCAVLAVHHSGHQNFTRARGSSAWRAGLDTEVVIVRDGERLTVKCTKQKDAEEFSDLQFTYKKVELPYIGPGGAKETSLVLCPSESNRPKALKQGAAVEALKDLTEKHGKRGVNVSVWRSALKEREIVIKSSAFDKLRKRMVENELIAIQDGKVRLL